MMVMNPRWLLYVACCVTVAAVAPGQRPQPRPRDAAETVKRYVALGLQGAPWADFAPLIAWEDEPGWDTYWLVSRYTVGTAEKKGTTVTVPVTYHRLGRYSHDFIFKPQNEDVTIRYEVLLTSSGWVIEGPGPQSDWPYLSVEYQIDALRTSQYAPEEWRKQAEAMAQELSELSRTKR
jgi:hypothetical protein